MSGIIMKSVLHSESTLDPEEIADEKVSDDSENDSSIKNFEDVDRRKVLEEDFRLAVANLPIGLATIPNNWNDLTVREQRDWASDKIRDHCTNLPESLVFLIVGNAIHGDCGRASDAVPEWLDREKFQRGQRFAMANYAVITFAEMLSLYWPFSVEYSLKPLIITGNSSEPFTAFKRYLSTVRRVRNWYSSDVWTEGSDGYEDMQTVRKMHANVRKKLSGWSYDKIDEAATIQNVWSTGRAKIRQDFRDSCQPPAPGQCPTIFSKEDQFRRPKNVLNQFEMAMTQFPFMGLIVLYPEKFGIHGASDEDIEAFCHLWRGLGYLLGIEDEFNFCRGSVEEVKQRSKDVIEYWVKPNLRDVTPEWEHMMRCVMEGISYYFPKISYELSLLYFTDVIGIPMPRLTRSLSFTSWIRYYTLKFSLSINGRLPGVMEKVNRRLIKHIDRALSFTDEELDMLRKKSEMTLAKGIADTIAVQKNSAIAESSFWRAAPFFVFSATFLLLNLPIIMKKIPAHIDLSRLVFVKS